MSRTLEGDNQGRARPLADRVDQACDAFEAAWLAGARPKIDDYLPETAGLERESYLRELLVLELAYRRRDGEHPNYAEYAARFPQHHAAIAAVFGAPSNVSEQGEKTDRARQAPTVSDRPTAPARLTLEVTAGPHKGRTFKFEEHDNFIVGRSPKAHFQLSKADSHFSRFHFLIEFNPPHCRLMDMGSTNGTLLNGKKVERADLSDRDMIQGGTTTMRVAIELATDEPPALPETVSYHGARTADVGPTLIKADEGARDAATKERVGPIAVDAVAEPEVGSSDSPCRACGATVTGLGGGESAHELHPGRATLCATCQSAIVSQPQPIFGYEIIRELGRGGMGVVALARRTSDGSLIAIKTVIPDVAATPADIAKFLREARILSELDHPHIVRCLDVGDAANLVFFAMDYVPGRDALQLVRDLGVPLPVDRAVRLTCQILEALAYAHARRFVHRDIKPNNLLVTVRDGKDVSKLADFGLARVYQSSRLSGLTITGDVQGTPAFMPPEQITRYRDVLPTSDIYSVGATLYYLLTRRYVYDFPKRLEQRILKILEEDPIPIRTRRPDLPRPLAEIIDRCLLREPEDRLASAETLRESLLPFLRSEA
jgi:serine/threonine-protein kinase